MSGAASPPAVPPLARLRWPAVEQPVNALAIDTTSDYLGLALMKEGRPVANHYALSGTQANRTLLQLLDTLLGGARLKPRDLHVLLVARGPGSFTGTRIGMAVALTCAQVTGAPLLGVDTLHLLAAQSEPADDGRTIHAVLNAARDEVYHAPFRWTADGLEALADVRLLDIDTLADEIGDAPAVLRRFAPGNSRAEAAFDRLRPAPLRWPTPDALRLLAVGLPRYLGAPAGPFPRVEPLYLKSEAFRKWRGARRNAS